MKKKQEQKHEHRYWPNSRQKSETCLICGFNPTENKKTPTVKRVLNEQGPRVKR